jgi:acyl-CoA synthetase (NDP forming)
VAAPHRALARAAARALYPQLAPEELRVITAAGAPAGLLADALAADGAHALASS